MDYSFDALNFLLYLPPSSMYQRVPYIASHGIMKGRIQAISRHMEGQESNESDPSQGKVQKDLDLCTDPDVRGYRGYIRVCTRL